MRQTYRFPVSRRKPVSTAPNIWLASAVSLP